MARIAADVLDVSLQQLDLSAQPALGKQLGRGGHMAAALASHPPPAPLGQQAARGPQHSKPGNPNKRVQNHEAGSHLGHRDGGGLHIVAGAGRAQEVDVELVHQQRPDGQLVPLAPADASEPRTAYLPAQGIRFQASELRAWGLRS